MLDYAEDQTRVGEMKWGKQKEYPNKKPAEYFQVNW